jgi:putative FmdB family regulatory protein
MYEYSCAECRHAFEQWIASMDSPEKPACPKCGGRKVERMVSVFAARQGASRSEPAPPMGGGCGRCGDASGPCSMR